MGSYTSHSNDKFIVTVYFCPYQKEVAFYMKFYMSRIVPNEPMGAHG